MSRGLTPQEYRALLRRDFHGFVGRTFYQLHPQALFMPAPHIEAMCAAFEECLRGKIKRLIINVPPRSLKSLTGSVAFPAYVLGHDPTANIICVSYGQDLSMKLALDCRNVMTSRWYQAAFNTRLSPSKQGTNDFMTTRNGTRLATSIEGVLTGRGADFIIIDDPLKPDEAFSDTHRKKVNNWYDGTLLSRLNSKVDGVIILIMQRLHMDDLVGHVLGQEQWKVLSFPAIAEKDEEFVYQTPYGPQRFVRRAGDVLHPEREPKIVLDQMRLRIGEYNFAGQYQQDPIPPGGGMVKATWFKTFDLTNRPSNLRVIQSWDTASKQTELSDYSVCTTWGVEGNKIYLLDVLRARLAFPELKRAVQDMQRKFSASAVLIEDKASGTQLIQELRYNGMAVKEIKPTENKVMRMNAQTPQIESGFVHLPTSAPWLTQYVTEMTTFPYAKHDDQVDSTSQALEWIAFDAMRPRVSVQPLYL
ncbi:MAG: phage terminase large subunit [Gammaproteobacteria bacterium]